MKQYADFINPIIDYFKYQQKVSKGEVSNKWFDEFFVVPSNDKILAKYEDAIECRTRSITKELLDSQSTFVRAKNIRDKRRADFFIGNAVRMEGAIHRFARKNEALNLDTLS